MTPEAETALAQELAALTKRSVWQRLADCFFGYDFFISYRWKDGRVYAVRLAAELKERGFDCFLDSEEFAKGVNWKTAGAIALRRTSRLILVVSPGVAESAPVLREVRIFAGSGRTIIPIEFSELPQGTLPDDHPLREFLRGSDVLRIEENGRCLGQEPSETALDDLQKGFKLTRQSTKRMRALQGFAFTLAALLIAVALFWKQAVAAKRDALRQSRISTSQRLAAQSEAALVEHPQRALLLGVEAARVSSEAGDPPTTAAQQALLRALNSFGGRQLAGQIDHFTPLRVSPDGRWLAAVGPTNTVLLWNLTNVDAVPKVLLGHKKWIKDLVFSPDNRWLVSAGNDKTARVWDLANPEAGPLILKGHTNRIESLTVTADSSQVLTASADGTIRIWALNRQQEPPRIVKHLDPNYDDNSLAKMDFVFVSPDGRRLIAAGSSSIWIHDLKNPAKAPVILRQQGLEKLLVTLDWRYLIAGNSDELQVWRLADPSQAAILDCQSVRIFKLASDHAGKQVAVSGLDGNVRLWNLDQLWNSSTRTVKPLLVLSGHAGAVTALAFSPNDRYLVSGGVDKTAIVRELKSGNPATDPLVLRGHEDSIDAVTFSPDSRQLFTASRDLTVRLWNLESPWSLPVVLRGHTHTVDCVAVASGTSQFVTGDLDGNARVWNLEKLSAPPTIITNFHVANGVTDRDPLYAVAISPNGRYVVTGKDRGGGSEGRLWDLKDPSKPRSVFSEPSSTFKTVALSPDGKWLALDGGLGEASLLRINESSELRLMRKMDPWVKAFAFSGDGSKLVTASDAAAHVWDLKNLDAPPVSLKATSTVTAVAVSSNGQWIATGGEKGEVLVFDMQRPKTPLVLLGHQSGIVALAMSPDASRLASADHFDSNASATTSIWHLNAPGSPRIILHRSLESVAFSPDGRRLIGTGGYSVYVWNLPVEELVTAAGQCVGRNFSRKEWQEYFPDQPYNPTFRDLIVPSDFRPGPGASDATEAEDMSAVP